MLTCEGIVSVEVAVADDFCWVVTKGSFLTLFCPPSDEPEHVSTDLLLITYRLQPESMK